MKHKTAIELIEQAKVTLMLDFHLFGFLLMNLPIVERIGFNGIGTDGKAIYYDPEFIEKYDSDEVAFILAHECFHPAFNHHARLLNKDFETWNEACDYVINPILLESGLKFPQGLLLDYQYKSMDAEQVYNKLYAKKQQKQQQQSNDNSQNNNGNSQSNSASNQKQNDSSQNNSDENSTMNEYSDMMNELDNKTNFGGVLPSQDEPEKSEQEWHGKLHQAYEQSKMFGNLPSGLDRLIKDIVEPKIDYTILLENYIEKSAYSGFDWLQPNQLYSDSDFIMPSVISDNVTGIILVMDTSGSVSDKDIAQFQSCLERILYKYETELHVLYVDSEVHEPQTFGTVDSLKNIKPKGGGGTSYKPTFEYIEKQNIMPTVLIYMTDFYCDRFPDKVPYYPVIWLDTAGGYGKNNLPFGDYVKLYND